MPCVVPLENSNRVCLYFRDDVIAVQETCESLFSKAVVSSCLRFSLVMADKVVMARFADAICVEACFVVRILLKVNPIDE